MEITVLGSGCKSCKRLLENVKEVVAELNLDCDVIYQTDIIEISKKGIMKTPALMIDDHIVATGYVLETEEIKKLLR